MPPGHEEPLLPHPLPLLCFALQTDDITHCATFYPHFPPRQAVLAVTERTHFHHAMRTEVQTGNARIYQFCIQERLDSPRISFQRGILIFCSIIPTHSKTSLFLNVFITMFSEGKKERLPYRSVAEPLQKSCFSAPKVHASSRATSRSSGMPRPAPLLWRGGNTDTPETLGHHFALTAHKQA